MTVRGVPPALSSEALFGKSKVYIQRGLAAKDRGDHDEYQLWSSLALELIGKSALAAIHPCLIADPNSHVSLFGAAGHPIGTDIKTIAAHTVFDRVGHLTKDFDKSIEAFCRDFSLKRNAELHSGEAPFEASTGGSWEGRFWHAAEIILQVKGETIETWLGANDSQAPQQIIDHYRAVMREAALSRVEVSKKRFLERKPKEQKAAHEAAAKLSTYAIYQAFNLSADEIWRADCPACGGSAFLAGIEFGEEATGDIDPDFPDEEWVDKYHTAEEFICTSCDLHLESRSDIEAVGLDPDYTKSEIRKREYEAEYGND